ncbi:MAG: uncharacterized protein PWQ55_1040 [Chloroflexota bacterium]|nr:uncharacterized protein [Chloroflexota bacterium]
MSDERPFWLTKRLDEMTQAEWESLCDGCGICCLYKLEDEDSGEVFMTNVACRFLDREACVCMLYEERRSAMPTCIQLTPAKVAQLKWLPDTCAYRLVLQGKPLPAWHPLVSGSRETVHEADVSVRGKVISEVDVNMDDLEEYVVEESD